MSNCSDHDPYDFFVVAFMILLHSLGLVGAINQSGSRMKSSIVVSAVIPESKVAKRLNMPLLFSQCQITFN